MTRRRETIPAAHFDAMYTDTPDPWGFRSSDYEREKYARTLTALDRPRYARGLEVGCSIGVFTWALAGRCDALLAIDGSGVALEEARAACAAVPGVTFAQRMVPAGFPPGQFDLVVLSEVLYYLAPDDLDAVARLCLAAQPAGGTMVLCHWLGETDYPLTGEEASRRFIALAEAAGYRHAALHGEVYRLDRLSSPSSGAS